MIDQVLSSPVTMQAKGPNVSFVNVQHSTVMEALVLNKRTVLYLGTEILKDNIICTENVINVLNDNLFGAKGKRLHYDCSLTLRKQRHSKGHYGKCKKTPNLVKIQAIF